jgi:hypothetical protein
MTKNTFDIGVADEIKHLSPDEIEELYQKYLDGEKNAVLINDYKINITPNKLIKVLPPIMLNETRCPYCDLPMFKKRRSKSAASRDTPPIECYECSHKILPNQSWGRMQQCGCEECVVTRKHQQFEVRRGKRELVRGLYSIDDKEPIHYSELTFFNKLILLTIFMMQTDEDFEYILSLDDPSRTAPLSPTDKMDIDCLRELFNCSAIIIDPESGIEAFDEGADFKSFHINRVRWLPNITLDGVERAKLNVVYKEIYRELQNRVQPIWEKELYKILFRIAGEELLQYIHIKSEELNVAFSAENKTRDVIEELLHHFSVSEIYCFVKNAVESAHIYYSKGHAKSKKHAANTIPNKMLYLGERAVNEGWNTYKYSRDRRAPRSYISKIFYDSFLQDEDAGFNKVPEEYWNLELFPKYFCTDEDSNESDLCCSECSSTSVSVQMTDVYLVVTCKDCRYFKEFTPST